MKAFPAPVLRRSSRRSWSTIFWLSAPLWRRWSTPSGRNSLCWTSRCWVPSHRCTGPSATGPVRPLWWNPDRDGLHIYRNTLGVMTNSPGYLWHRTNLLNYAGIRDLDHGAMELAGQQLTPCFSGSGAQGLPGDWSSPSRFVRLAFLKTYGVKGATESAGVGAMFRLLQSAAFPLGMVRVPQPESPGGLEGDILPYDYTVYTAVACAESLRFYWTTYENQRIQFVDLSTLRHQTRPVQFELGRWAGFPGAGPCVCICGLSHLICLLVVIPTDSRRYL